MKGLVLLVSLLYVTGISGDKKVCRTHKGFGTCLPEEECYGQYIASGICGRNVCCLNPKIVRRKCLDYRREVFGDDLGKAYCESKNKTLNRIVGGWKAEQDEYPFAAAVGFETNHTGLVEWMCGGVIISHNFVLSAAHCYSSSMFRNPSTKVTTWVMVGWTKVNDLSHSNSVGREVVHITIHPHYGGFNHHHDIAILRLGVPLELSPRILPACLVFEHELYYIKNVLVSGWGKLDETDPYGVPDLRAVELKVVDSTVCNNFFPSWDNLYSWVAIHPSMLCAGHPKESKDSCQGDSGGPLTAPLRDYSCVDGLVGIVSYGQGCGYAGVPAVYTRIPYFLTWIARIVWPGEDKNLQS